MQYSINCYDNTTGLIFDLSSQSYQNTSIFNMIMANWKQSNFHKRPRTNCILGLQKDLFLATCLTLSFSFPLPQGKKTTESKDFTPIFLVSPPNSMLLSIFSLCWGYQHTFLKFLDFHCCGNTIYQ